MRTIIAGSRDSTKQQVEEAIASCPWVNEITVVLSGTARGADKYGEEWAKRMSLPVEMFPTDWNRYGKAAGPIRNKQMAERAEALIAVWDGVSSGTKNMIDNANSLGLRVFVFRFAKKP